MAQPSPLPLSIQRLIDLAKDKLEPKKIILFGSRARGDHRPHSDFDLAFVGVTDRNAWNRFTISIQEDPITLQSVDLVLFEELNDDYKKNIEREGFTLYEQ